jgi:hypothetical protein
LAVVVPPYEDEIRSVAGPEAPATAEEVVLFDPDAGSGRGPSLSIERDPRIFGDSCARASLQPRIGSSL